MEHYGEVLLEAAININPASSPIKNNPQSVVTPGPCWRFSFLVNARKNNAIPEAPPKINNPTPTIFSTVSVLMPIEPPRKPSFQFLVFSFQLDIDSSD